ncbi:FecR domain-containing protein [Pedobacter sp. B4-66]|uniref:FecR family protein n=1 Tax=Pedobacter sp. B4-66 TaxID=2817280 RepID=UPI001BDAFCD0|nr:FecR domain-containing protein [Pedobacter sp. B4-66]
MAQETDKILIRKFIAGSCTSQEQERMKIFMEQPGSQELFDQVMDEDWRAFKKEAPATDEYILSFQQRLNKRHDENNTNPFPIIRRNNFYRYAAVWTVLIFGFASYGLWQVKKETVRPQTVSILSSHNPNGQRSTITLSDSSVVTLGAGSSISYPERFTDSTREVSLQGEAFFEITKNPEKPFIVQTGDVQTKVLGTSFKIEAFKGQKIAVAVATGKVQVDRKMAGSGKLESLAVLLPGDAIGFNPVTGLKTNVNIPVVELTGWKKGKLTFTGTPLGEMLKVLERWYNVKIELRNKQIGRYMMNVQLDGTKPLTQSLEILKATTKAGYIIKDKTVIIQ